MQQVTIFNSPRFGEIRVSGTPDSPLFCLADVCKVLELRVDGVMTRLKKDAPNRIGVIDSLGREQQAIFINEQNLYKVIMRSDKPQAEPFQDWVCGEVLPSIRKDGAYMTPSTLEQALTSPDFLIRLATQLKQEREKRAEVEEIAKKRQATITKPDGSVLVSSTPKVTPKGQMHIISKFMGEHREESKIAI